MNNPSDLYLKITDKHGAQYIACLRAWDRSLLLESQQRQHSKEGGSAEMSSKEAYDAQISAGRAA